MSRPLIVVGGTTASGKSQIAMELAKQINGVIINGDSRQVYKELMIGTARPKEEEIENIPHYLYGHISVKDKYNIYSYQHDVYAVLEQIPKDKACIIVGGTGLYIDSVIYNYQLQKIITNTGDLNGLTLEELQQRVPIEVFNVLNNSERHNPRRLMRIIQRGYTSKPNRRLQFPTKYFVVDLPDDILKDRVKLRIEKMFKEGLEKECAYLWEHGYFKYPALNTIGYAEFQEYFEKKIPLESVKDNIFKNTTKYIKRQRTWFKRHKDATFTSDTNLILEESQHLLKIT